MVVILSEAKDRSRHASKARGSHVSPTRSFASLRMTPGSIGVSLHTTISKPTGSPPDAGRGKLRLPYWGSKVMTQRPSGKGTIPMTIHRIRLLGDPILRAKCEPITKPRSTAVRVILDDMRETLRDWQSRFGSGRAIAAPQIGAPVRMVYCEMDQPWALINPEIVDIGYEDFEVWDDCFSFPNLLVRVSRAYRIRVRSNFAYVAATYASATDVLDISDPTNPVPGIHFFRTFLKQYELKFTYSTIFS